MSFSIQRETSDGTLSTLDLTIEYIDQADVHAYVNDIEIDLTGGSTPYTWKWNTPSQIEITPAVPNGLVAMVKRSTPMDALYHNFDAGAVFKDETIDENFKQVLFLSQEAKEGASVTDIYSNVNMHGYVIGNHGAAALDGDLVTFGQYRNDSLGSGFNRVAAEAARDVAVGARDTAVASAAAAALSESNASGSAVSAGNSASSANDDRVLAEQAAVAAASSWDSFADMYLGPKASDPTVDNDGDPLLTGALYWNTAAIEMRAYNGSVWVVAYNTGGVTTFNSRTGTVLPVTGDYSADMVNYGGGSVADVLDTTVTSIQAGSGITVSRSGSAVTVAAPSVPQLVTDVSNLNGRLTTVEGEKPLGWGQTWQNVKTSRMTGGNYTNTTGRPIVVAIRTTFSNTSHNSILYVDDLPIQQFFIDNSSFSKLQSLSVIVPHGSTYRVDMTFSAIDTWMELR